MYVYIHDTYVLDRDGREKEEGDERASIPSGGGRKL